MGCPNRASPLAFWAKLAIFRLNYFLMKELGFVKKTEKLLTEHLMSKRGRDYRAEGGRRYWPRGDRELKPGGALSNYRTVMTGVTFQLHRAWGCVWWRTTEVITSVDLSDDFLPLDPMLYCYTEDCNRVRVCVHTLHVYRPVHCMWFNTVHELWPVWTRFNMHCWQTVQ